MDADILIFEAQEILGQEPLPPDAQERLESLERQAPEDERWEWIWEGFEVATAG